MAYQPCASTHTWTTLATRKEIKLAKERGELPAILPPKKPPTAFCRFMKQFYKDWQAREGRGSFAAVGLAWRRLSEEEKKKYYDPAEWEEYRRKMDEYLQATISSTHMMKKTTPYILFRAEKLVEMGHDGSRKSLVAKSPIIAKTWETLSYDERDKYGDSEEWEEYHRKKDQWASSKDRTNTRTPYIIFRAEKLIEMGHDGTRESLVAKSPIIIKTWRELSSAEKDVRTLPTMVLSKIC
ncbi:hypothetical protein K443DRAFT_131467 [Laccaria amethystina LaAM-08-1]|uniref:Unplaced genomic scaffold K443scaffold_47, whole genome shotgun sequence n=1 Tax=Laccaria amethystina LaAM-08-1 TaxID=1095629 RepID=A0A0C9XNY6_9AGAR|nr:hypothetical protein K443DRAFT_131467 [Laccaria amethystina LaAM-08-1]